MAPQRHPLAAFEIAGGADPVETRRREQRAHCGALVVAVLQQQPSAGMQVIGRAGDDRADRVESVAARRQRIGRFETQVVALTAAGRFFMLGRIDEVPDGDEGDSHCIIPRARVSGPGTEVQIEIPGPLLLPSADGSYPEVRAQAVRYRLRASPPALIRELVR